MARVVVIGAGIGGLAAAARLSVKRHQVTVVERNNVVGGKAARFTRDGFVFDTGPSLLTLPAVYRDLFLKTGTALEENVDLQPVEPGFRYWFPDGSDVTLPGVGIAPCANAFGSAFGGDAGNQWRELMARARDIWALTRRPFLESPISGLRDLRPLARDLSSVRKVAPYRSMHGLARRYLKDPRLLMVLDRYATYAGSDPYRAPAALTTIPYVEQTFGAWHIGGGITTLADALAARCTERRVDLRLGCEVASISTDESGVTGVVTATGERIPADIVVANCDAQVLYHELIDDPRASAARKALDRTTPSFSGFSIMLAVDGRTPGIAHHNVWFPSQYRNEFRELFAGKAVTDPAIYACVPDDPKMRPDANTEAWFILVNAPRHGHTSGTVDWGSPGRAQQYADSVIAALAQRGCDLRQRIRWREIRTPADIGNDTRSPGGSIYGTSSNGMRAAFARPANASPVPNLYLVGGSSHPGGGLPLVGLSAEIVANLIGRG